MQVNPSDLFDSPNPFIIYFHTFSTCPAFKVNVAFFVFRASLSFGAH